MTGFINWRMGGERRNLPRPLTRSLPGDPGATLSVLAVTFFISLQRLRKQNNTPNTVSNTVENITVKNCICRSCAERLRFGRLQLDSSPQIYVRRTVFISLISFQIMHFHCLLWCSGRPRKCQPKPQKRLQGHPLHQNFIQNFPVFPSKMAVTETDHPSADQPLLPAAYQPRASDCPSRK